MYESIWRIKKLHNSHLYLTVINVIEGVPLLGQNAIITEEDRLFGPGISDPMRSAIVMSPNL